MKKHIGWNLICPNCGQKISEAIDHSEISYHEQGYCKSQKK